MPHLARHRARYRFGDVVEKTSETRLLPSGITYHQPQGNESFAQILSRCREYGVRVAAVYYDLIPIRESAYQEYRRLHTKYVLELLRADNICPILRFSPQDLLAFLERDAGLSDSMLHDLPRGSRRCLSGSAALAQRC